MIELFKLSEIDPEILKRIMKRAGSEITNVKPVVSYIIEQVRSRGNEALVEYTREFDRADFSVSDLRVSKKDVEEAYRMINPEVISFIREQIRLSTAFHKAQRAEIVDWEKNTASGVSCGEKWTPIDEVGLYVPGGKNPFPTVAQILAVAATTAGCNRIAMCISPNDNNWEVIIAASECGVEEIYRVSGAQAVAALAYGTETIQPVKLIAGPGNPYVTCAKILVQDTVVIDMPAGPSEAIILADESTPQGFDLERKAKYCAADILARAEHGADSAGVLITNCAHLAQYAAREVARQMTSLSRLEKHIKPALENYCAIIICESMNEAVDFTNRYAPEHLEILTGDPKRTFEQIVNAGSVFLGYSNPVAAGDYASGINHILPASGWADRCSAVGVWTFMKRVQYSTVSKAGLRELQPIIQAIAQVEGLDAHYKSVNIRFE